MGNHPKGVSAPVIKTYSSAAWIEARAEDQLDDVARLKGVDRVVAFPDLHPGKYGPVGCAIAVDRLYPRLVGSDIGCGMGLFALDLSWRRLKIDKAARRLRALEGPLEENAQAHLEEAGLPENLSPSALGTIGGGNHFCELQRVVEVGECGRTEGLERDDLVLLVHSGSRSLGMSIFESVVEHPRDGLAADSEEGRRYLMAHDHAVAWAALNRRLIAARAAEALRCDSRLICDAPHNLVTRESGRLVHRKGAARAEVGSLVPLAGSRESASRLVEALQGVEGALSSLAHGAGRKYDRRSMHGRVPSTRSNVTTMAQPSPTRRVICEDRDLLVEEAGLAYKDLGRVLSDLETAGLARSVATLEPVITFKRVVEKGGRDDG